MEASAARVEVYDLLGAERTQIDLGILPAGAHSIPVNLSGLPSGTYFIRYVDSDGPVVRSYCSVR
jgi:hypothetical protein